MDSRSKRYVVSRGHQSPLPCMRWPNSCKNFNPMMFLGPSDSCATGIKSWVAGKFAYFVPLRSAACSAVARVVEAVRYDDAHVWIAWRPWHSMHATYLPLDHGIIVAPSGLLPIGAYQTRRFLGGLELGKPDFARALQMMSLMMMISIPLLKRRQRSSIGVE